jgi:hypothetical protein
VTIARQEIGDSRGFDCQRVPVIDIRMPLKAVMCGLLMVFGDLFDTVGVGYKTE